MQVTVVLDDDLVQRARELTGITDLSLLMREGLKALIYLEASRALAAHGGSNTPLNPLQ